MPSLPSTSGLHLHGFPPIPSRPQRPLPTVTPTTWRENQMNVFSGVVSILVVVVVSAALSQPQWFWVEGGGCNTNSLGLYPFLHPGHFTAVEGEQLLPTSPHLIYYTNGEVFKFCVTPSIVELLRIVTALTFVVIWSAVVQMLLDIAGPSSAVLTTIRKNALPSIFSVIVCVGAIGVCYYIITLVDRQQEATKPLVGTGAIGRVQVKLDIGFYLLVCSGCLSVVAVACNWLRPRHIFQQPGNDTSPLMQSQFDGLEGYHNFDLNGGNHQLPILSYLNDLEPPPPVEGYPPPPYTP